MLDGGHFRSRARKPFAIRVRYRAVDATSVRDARTRDLGFGGAFIETGDVLEVGTRVRLLLTTATTWEPLELPAKVVWIRDGQDAAATGFGVRFDALTPIQATALHSLLESASFAVTQGSADE